MSRVYLVRAATGGRSWVRTPDEALAWGKLLVPIAAEEEARVRAALADDRVAEWGRGLSCVIVTPYRRTSDGYEPILETMAF